jgi:hypothetical protein
MYIIFKEEILILSGGGGKINYDNKLDVHPG